MPPTSTIPVSAEALERRILLAIPSFSEWALLEVVEALQLLRDPEAELERLLRYATSPRVECPASYLLTCARRALEAADRAA